MDLQKWARGQDGCMPCKRPRGRLGRSATGWDSLAWLQRVLCRTPPAGHRRLMVPLLWIPLVALAWYRYATEDWVAPWMFWGLLVATAWLAYTLFQATRATAAASNLVAAAATFARLGADGQLEVHARATTLQSRTGGSASTDNASPF